MADVAVRNQEAMERLKAADRRTDRFERNLTRLARLGLKARSDLKKRQEQIENNQEQHEKRMARVELNLAEITDKLNGLIGHVQGQFPPQ